MAAQHEMARRLASGDEAQIRIVVEKYDSLLSRVARRYVGAAHVDDVVQEVWMAALRGIDRFEGRGSFEGWLLSITSNIAKTWGVHEARSTPVDELPECQAGTDTPPEQRLLSSERLQVAKAAVGKLTPKLRRALELGDTPGLAGSDGNAGNARAARARGDPIRATRDIQCFPQRDLGWLRCDPRHPDKTGWRDRKYHDSCNSV